MQEKKIPKKKIQKKKIHKKKISKRKILKKKNAINEFQTTQRNQFLFLWNQPKSDYIHILPIYYEPNRIPFGVNSIGK